MTNNINPLRAQIEEHLAFELNNPDPRPGNGIHQLAVMAFDTSGDRQYGVQIARQITDLHTRNAFFQDIRARLTPDEQLELGIDGDLQELEPVEREVQQIRERVILQLAATRRRHRDHLVQQGELHPSPKISKGRNS